MPTSRDVVRSLRHAPASAYAFAVVVSMAAAGTTILAPFLHPRPYVLSFGAVALAAWFGGFGPALLSGALTLVVMNVFLMRVQAWGLYQAMAAALFAGLGILVAYAARAMARSESQARRQSARLEAMFGQAAVGIAHLSLSGHLDRVNQRMAAITGRTAAAMLEGTCESLVHPADWPGVAEAMRALAAGTRDEFSTDVRCLHVGGQPRWVHLSLTPLVDEAGRPEGLIAIVEDVHERHTAEARAHLSEERARLALDVARIGTWGWKHGAEDLIADERTREICGVPLEGPLAFEAVVRRVHPDDWPRVRASLARAFEAGERYAEEFRLVHENGAVRWVVSRAVVVAAADSTGGPRMMLGSLLDITEHRLAEDALKLADRQKDDFLALLSHELRNPLAPIRTAVHLLKMRHAPDADSQRLHAVIERQVQHLVHLVDDLLDVSRVLRDKIELRPRTLDMADVVAMAAETTRPLLDQQRQQLQIDLPPVPVHVHGDQVRLSQVIGNLLHNASKFSDRGSTVLLGVGAEDGRATIRVRDTGAGIAPDLLPAIFDPFVQADRSLERSPGGLGIGLTLVRKIVELHGGSVAATSAGPGRGSEFIVCLPAVAAPDHAPVVAALPEPAPRAGLRILVVDDNSDAAESLAALLRSRGQVVRIAYNGPDALADAIAHPPDLVLLDIGLPGMNGYEVASALRRQPDGGPALVAITGYGQDADARRAADAGFDRHLVKPVAADQLDHVLAAVVR